MVSLQCESNHGKYSLLTTLFLPHMIFILNEIVFTLPNWTEYFYVLSKFVIYVYNRSKWLGCNNMLQVIDIIIIFKRRVIHELIYWLTKGCNLISMLDLYSLEFITSLATQIWFISYENFLMTNHKDSLQFSLSNWNIQNSLLHCLCWYSF